MADAFRRGEGWVRALRTREFEPDGPNYTPRISGMVRPDGAYRLSILKSAQGNPACCQRFFFEYDAPIAGQGHFISTYDGDGSPLPSFTGEPRPTAITAPDAETLAAELWQSLHADNKVSLFVRFINLESGQTETVLRNKHQ